MPRFPYFLWIVFFLSAGILPGQIAPERPIQNYRLPFFNEEGKREWEVRGEQGIYLDADRIQLKGSRVQIFPLSRQTRGVPIQIRSEQALVQISDRLARGTGGIHWQHALGTGTAGQWTFSNQTRILLLEDDVDMHLTIDLGNWRRKEP